MRLDGLTGVRFFLALYVVLYHLLPFKTLPASHVKSALSNGPISVAVFFFLSGFILSYTYRSPQFSRWKFFVSRFARIYPVFLLGLLMATFPRVLGRPDPTLTWPSWIVSALMLQDWFASTRFVWNDPAWSLSAEAFFYVIFPIAWVLLARLRDVSLLYVACVALAVRLVIAVLYLKLAAGRDAGDSILHFVAFFPPLRLPDFIAGMAVGALYIRREEHTSGDRRRSVIGTICFVVLVVALCETPDAWTGIDWPSDLLMPVLLMPAFAGLIYALTSPTFWLTRVLSFRFLVLLGESSYALYILHRPLTFWIRVVLLTNSKDPERLKAALDTSFPHILALVVAECAICVGVFFVLERPAREAIRRLLLRRTEQHP